jgi:hypothetical protein
MNRISPIFGNFALLAVLAGGMQLAPAIIVQPAHAQPSQPSNQSSGINWTVIITLLILGGVSIGILMLILKAQAESRRQQSIRQTPQSRDYQPEYGAGAFGGGMAQGGYDQHNRHQHNPNYGNSSSGNHHGDVYPRRKSDFDAESGNQFGDNADFADPGNVSDFDADPGNVSDFDAESGNVSDFDAESGNVSDFDAESGNQFGDNADFAEPVYESEPDFGSGEVESDTGSSDFE